MKHCIPLLTVCGVMFLGLGLSGCSEQDLLKLLDNQTVTQDSTDEELALNDSETDEDAGVTNGSSRICFREHSHKRTAWHDEDDRDHDEDNRDHDEEQSAMEPDSREDGLVDEQNEELPEIEDSVANDHPAGVEHVREISASGGCESHRFGEDCLGCHVAESHSEASEVPFTLAGSVYQRDGISSLANSSALVHFYTEPYGRGERVLTLSLDAHGNFYTTEPVEKLAQGLYVELEHQGYSTFMSAQPTTTGQCSTCHSTSSVYPGTIYAP
jgi:hypothetical protein